jgi:hypothetical protein
MEKKHKGAEESLAGPALFPVFGECYNPGNRVNACYRQEH